MTIFKYPIGIAGVQTVTMPQRARILTVQMQGELPFIWAEVENQNAKEERIIELFGTGHPMGARYSRKYIGTVQQDGGALIWHVYERTGVFQ